MSALTLVGLYGLDALLTPEDDPALWEAALRQHWNTPDDPACLVDALRFGVGRLLAEDEAMQGEANGRTASMRGMVNVEEWGFKRLDRTHLSPIPLDKNSLPPPAILPGFGLFPAMFMPPGGVITADTTVPQAPDQPQQVALIYLTISRPSLNQAQAAVYFAATAPGVGDGATHLWQRQNDGDWRKTSTRLTWWIT